MTKELKDLLLTTILICAVALFGITGTAVVITKEKNRELDTLAKTYNAHLNNLLDEREELIKEIAELEYRTSRTLHCSLSMVECNE